MLAAAAAAAAAAVTDAYRNAVALNPRDYRAWYGLGQTYELLSMPHYALHYYRCVGCITHSAPPPPPGVMCGRMVPGGRVGWGLCCA
jgi:hypothetical protein